MDVESRIIVKMIGCNEDRIINKFIKQEAYNENVLSIFTSLCQKIDDIRSETAVLQSLVVENEKRKKGNSRMQNSRQQIIEEHLVLSNNFQE